MSNWELYLNDRLKKDHELGFSVIVPKEHSKPIPLFCPVCNILMRSADDADYFRKKSCCQKCGMKWADANGEKWSSGWRPSQNEIDEEVKIRQSYHINMNLDGFDF